MAPTTRSKTKKATAVSSSGTKAKKTNVSKKSDGAVKENAESVASYDGCTTMIGTREWADSDEDEPNWMMLFPTDNANSRFLSPRMLAMLFNAGIVLADEFNLGFYYRLEQLPPIARSCFRQSQAFRFGLLACFERILRRLKKGIIPFPNCVGEMLALDLMIENAEEEGTLYDYDRYEHYPKSPLDFDFDLVYATLFPSSEDQLVIQILSEQAEESDESFYGDDWEEASQIWSNDGPSPLDDSSLDMLELAQQWVMVFPTFSVTGKLANLHPGKWFVAFAKENMTNHL